MNRRLRTYLYLFGFSQLAIGLLSFIFYHELTMLSYINISFYLASLFVFTSLVFFTINSGFLDLTAKSFRLLFAGKDVSKEQVEEMRPLSQIFSFHYSPLLVNGILLTLFMLIALFVFST